MRIPRSLRYAAPVLLMLSTGCGKSSSSTATGADGGAAAAVGPAGAAMAALLDGFEGAITISMKDASKPKPVPPINLMVKGARLRADLPEEVVAGHGPVGNKGYVIIDTPDKKLEMVMDERKQVVVLDLNTIGEQFKSMSSGVEGHGAPPGGPSHAPPKVTKTGKMDTVAGYSCETWEVVPDTGEKADVCVANEGASWFHLPLTGIPTEHAWALELLDGKHFPLRFIGFDKVGAEKMRVEVTKIDKKPLAQALFEVPPGYQVMDLGQMMAGMMGQMPGMAGGPPGLGGAPGGLFHGGPHHPGGLPPGVPPHGKHP